MLFRQRDRQRSAETVADHDRMCDVTGVEQRPEVAREGPKQIRLRHERAPVETGKRQHVDAVRGTEARDLLGPAPRPAPQTRDEDQRPPAVPIAVDVQRAGLERFERRRQGGERPRRSGERPQRQKQSPHQGTEPKERSHRHFLARELVGIIVMEA